MVIVLGDAMDPLRTGPSEALVLWLPAQAGDSQSPLKEMRNKAAEAGRLTLGGGFSSSTQQPLGPNAPQQCSQSLAALAFAKL